MPEPYDALDDLNMLIRGYIVEIDDGLDGDYTIAYNGRTNPSQFTYTITNLNP